jgi:hypothetical protein
MKTACTVGKGAKRRARVTARVGFAALSPPYGLRLRFPENCIAP